MAWQTLAYRLTSACPMLMHNGRTANPLDPFAKAMKQVSGKRNKTDADHEELARLEFMAALYLGKNGPILPATVIDAVLTSAAKKSREGQLAKSGVFCLEHAELEYDGPRTAEELWKDEGFRHVAIVRVGTARVVRTRPVFNEWQSTIKIQVEDSVVNPARLIDWLHVAGTQVGIGGWRPQHGRFGVERLSNGG